PIFPGVQVTSPGFHAPLSHSGEPYDNSAWAAPVAGGSITFATAPYSVNPNANAARWGTLYNFRFDAAAPPITGTATIGLFAPGSPSSITAVGLPVPGAG